MSCSSTCHFVTLRSLSTNIATNVTWEEQLLAETGYLPLSFTPVSRAPIPESKTLVPSPGPFPSCPPRSVPSGASESTTYW